MASTELKKKVLSNLWLCLTFCLIVLMVKTIIPSWFMALFKCSHFNIYWFLPILFIFCLFCT